MQRFLTIHAGAFLLLAAGIALSGSSATPVAVLALVLCFVFALGAILWPEG